MEKQKVNLSRKHKKYIPIIAGRLAAEGLAKSNYSLAEAKTILSQTVLPSALTKILIECEQLIISQLPKNPLTDN